MTKTLLKKSVLLLFAVVVLVSCSKDDDLLYKPPQNLTNEQIMLLIAQAEYKMDFEQELTYNYTLHAHSSYTDIEFIYNNEYIFNKKTQTASQIAKYTDVKNNKTVLESYSYVNGSDYYAVYVDGTGAHNNHFYGIFDDRAFFNGKVAYPVYSGGDVVMIVLGFSITDIINKEGTEKKQLFKAFTDASSYLTMKYNIVSLGNNDSDNNMSYSPTIAKWKWKVENEKLVGTYSGEDYYGNTSELKYYVTLTNDMKYKEVCWTYSRIVKSDGREINRSGKYTFEYTANPQFSNEFNKNDFVDIRNEYYSATVNWSEGQGSNNFYRHNTMNITSSGFGLLEVYYKAPLVDFRDIVAFKIGYNLYSRGATIQLSNNNTVINALWEDSQIIYAPRKDTKQNAEKQDVESQTHLLQSENFNLINIE